MKSPRSWQFVLACVAFYVVFKLLLFTFSGGWSAKTSPQPQARPATPAASQERGPWLDYQTR